MSDKFTSAPAEAKAYIAQLVADIVANGNPDGDFTSELREAHARRQAFAKEMQEGTSERSRIARRCIATQVYDESRAKHNLRRTIASIEHEMRAGYFAKAREQMEAWT